MRTVMKGEVRSRGGEVFTGFVETRSVLGRMTAGIYRSACLELHPYGRQPQDPLDELPLAKREGLPRDVGSYIRLYDKLAEVCEPDYVRALEKIPIDQLPILAPQSGDWIKHYKVDRAKNVKVVEKDFAR